MVSQFGVEEIDIQHLWEELDLCLQGRPYQPTSVMDLTCRGWMEQN